MAKRPLDSSYITLSDDTIADDASIGDVLGTLAITAAYVGTPRWEIIGHSNFAVNATTGVVTVAHALTAGADSFKVKLRGTTPQINSPTFSFTVDTGGGGGGDYTASAVHFDGATTFTSSAFAPTDSPFGLFSVWTKPAAGFVDGEIDWFWTDGQFWAIKTNAVGNIAAFFWDTTNNFLFRFTADAILTDPSPWFSLQVAVDTNHPAGQKIGLITFNGVPLNVNVEADADDAFNIGWGQSSSGTYFCYLGNPPTPEMDVADLYGATGQFLDISNPVNIAKFVDGSGKPVSLGVDGSTPTGTAPTIFGSGDATTFMQPNLGTGGTFTLTAGSLTNATTSPSD